MGFHEAICETQADEVKHKDFCNTEFNKNEMETMENDNSIKDLTTKINDFASAPRGPDLQCLRRQNTD